MEGPALSWRERQILDAIETALREDSGLDQRLSAMRVGALRHPWLAMRVARQRRAARPDGTGGTDQAST